MNERQAGQKKARVTQRGEPFVFLDRKIDKPRASLCIYNQSHKRNASSAFLVTRSISWPMLFKADLSPEEHSVTPTN